MSTKEVDAPAGSTSSASPSAPPGLRAFADRWPFRRKLNVLVGIPLAVIALLLTYLVVDLVQEADRAENAARLVRDSTQVAQLVARLQAEHQQAILLSVRFEAATGVDAPSAENYRQTQTAVDEQVRKVVDAFGDRLPDTEAQALREVQGLAGLRQTIAQGYLPADNIDPAYSGAADGLIEGLGLEHDSALASTFTGNLLDSLLRADAAHGAYETGVFSAGTGDSNALIEFTGAVGSYELFTYQAARFERFASPAQSDEFSGIEHNTSQASISRHYADLAVDPSALQAESKADIRTALRAALARYPDYSAQAGSRLAITASLIDQIADRADAAASSARWRAVLLLSLALFCFALWITLSVLVRRSVVRPVLALTGAAQEVADVAGRELARVADDDAEEAGSPRLRELPVTADDEIGELAEAFNNVQTTAAALLERQVLSRRNVAEMFGNVGRRVSNLTTRQLALIDAVERGETDPALLERLYSIDHIAVRLRRNADSLMLLAGIRETVLDAGPTALTNVVRAALGQIEGFQRVRLRAATEAVVEPDIIGDLTLMIAELLENAVSFSPEDSPVEVVVGSDDDGASVTVSDHGLGMSAERLAEENARLVRRERLDVVPTKVLGLFVVGALARRWDVDVTLTRTPGGGVTAEVMIPSALLVTMSEAGRGVGSVSPGSSAPPASAGRTAAPSAPAAGPSPSASVPSWAAREDDPTVLPRRIPRREAAPATQPDDSRGAPPGREPGSLPAPAGSPAGVTAEDRTTRPASAATPGTGYGPGGAAGGASAAVRSRTPEAEPPTRVGAPGIPAPRTAERAPRTRAEAEPQAPAPSAERPAPGTTETTPAARAPEPTPEPTPEPSSASPSTSASASSPLPARRAAASSSFGPTEGAGGSASAPPEGLPPGGPRGAGAPASASAGEADAARPLRRRVRGATLRTDVDTTAQQTARRAARPADADAVRSALEEFEAAVARAHRDTGEHPRPADPAAHRTARGDDGRSDHGRDHRPDGDPDRTDLTDRTATSDSSGRDRTHHQNHLPEGAEQ
ncbi:signal transduction histidine kinase [Streptomyces sp. B4I13]|uniref:ATP-binding protein n=1 Tax=Streptomyces sp. B4I13 TaxID=3042271 RepID=UPI00278A028E|nr:ATP-binding protein [Streptomyces sp. B4I13]MDQ0958403.1 signal transduction histidine kinase [Streptomyces sp. B4I13]